MNEVTSIDIYTVPQEDQIDWNINGYFLAIKGRIKMNEVIPKTRKQELVRKIQQLPNDILESKGLYSLEIITLKIQIDYDSWLADRYKKYRVLSSDEHWLRFKIGEWTIAMEGEERE